MYSKILHIICLLICPFVYGQFVFTKTYTTDDGLLSNEINALYQDSRGLLWIGSSSGLLVKTMNDFVGVINVNENKFKNISSIIEDSKGNIWIGSNSHGVIWLNSSDDFKIFNTSNGLVSDKVKRIYHHKNNIYVGTDKGVSIIDATTYKVKTIEFNHKPKKSNFQITSFFEYKNGIFACTMYEGVFQIDVNRFEANAVYAYEGIYSVLPFQNYIYYGTKTGVGKFNTIDKKAYNYAHIPYVWGYQVKNNGTIYFVSYEDTKSLGGLYQINENVITNLNENYQLPHYDLISLALDNKNNTMYIGTKSNGLLEVIIDNPLKKIENNKAIQSLTSTNERLYSFSKEGLDIRNDTDEIVKSVSIDKFISYFQKQLPRFGNSNISDFNYKLINETNKTRKIEFFKSLIHNQSLWVSSNIGLFHLDLEGNFLEYLPLFTYHFDFLNQQLVQSSPNNVLRIFKDYKSLDYKEFTSAQSASFPIDITGLEALDDQVYIATAFDGLFTFSDDTFQNLNKVKGFTETKIKRLERIASDRLLVVSDYDDIYDINLRSFNFKKIVDQDKVKGKVIQSLILANKKLFIGTNKGMNIFEDDLKYLMDKEQGLDSYNFTAETDFNGNVYVGTKEGLYKITEYFENVVNDYNPNLKIYNVLVNGVSLNKEFKYSWFSLEGEELYLPYNKNNIRVLFTDWNAKFPKKVNFKYRLKSDKAWSNALTKREIDLNYLEPGTYDLELLIENLSTGKTYQRKILKIVIEPSFFQTLTFYVLLTVSVLLLSFVVYRYRLQNVRKRARLKNEMLLQKQDEERKRIHAENENILLEKNRIVLENKLSSTRMKALRSQMNPHFIFNALNTLQFFIISQNREKGLSYLSKFSKLVRETLENSINDYISLKDEIKYLEVYTSIENMRFEDRQIEFVFSVDESINVENILVPPMITQPFVENSILHAFDERVKKPRLEFIYKISNEFLICEIIDNGNGFASEPSEITRHISRGMSLVKERVALLLPDHEVPIYIEAKEGGTYVRITLPLVSKE